LTSNEIRVAQLASYVSEHACYHHGEASLQGAITSMAQDFVGANNINLLKPNGQFGSRNNAGKDAASPRYIYTLLEAITMTIFNKQDIGILTYLNDDGIDIEPEFYLPVIPLVLVNGALGIGTGFSTNIPCFNPRDIARAVRMMLSDEDAQCQCAETEFTPWYMGFKGTIEKTKDKFMSRGVFHKASATKIVITELPVGTWTEDYKEFLESMLEKDLKYYESHSTDKHVIFELQFGSSQTVDAYMVTDDNGFTKFEIDFKLVSSKGLGMNNMYLYNSQGQIRKYNTILEIICDFMEVRLQYYAKRKAYVCEELQHDIDVLANKIRFIKSVISGELIVSDMKKQELESWCVDKEYSKVNDSHDYLIKIPIYNLTTDKVKEFEDELLACEHKLKELQETTETQMWLTELTDFDKAYDKFYSAYLERFESQAESVSSKSSKKKSK
jgi:DNA topoisomerase-2